ncbi:LysR family transcriptional regulator [Aeromonas veronii]|uniref:LysR family transcriptional regulator n=1 Tax=Aeromonas veronii TaxID=654 RepID=A0AAC9FLY0_AERVE|nr:LysR family transcriptional regulator [Aeromonas veronii]ANB53199.1 LysR family transcriptional regulator [Aeromonas veronii]MBJ7588705.1 LysR family transcriptional regulator [Aeromonas veronii]MBL0630768.1 LysR family transcriptional regulator [Aeromonas veronii]QET80630.1 LysR family transcriptional regulator [Aeromonas veronii]BBT97095.1 LysR family transcriptional regulator [Aeromonas veronii]
MVNPLWLHTLVVVHETGSFTRAAERLDLTQAAVSQHISRLEAEFGPLLLRKPRQLELTPRGLVLLDFARQQAQAAEQLRARLSDDDPHRGAITLTTPGSIGLLLYPLLLDQQQEHPELTIQHRFAPTPDIVQAVLAGRSDLGLVDQPPEHPSIAAEPFAREPLCLVVPNDGEEPSWQHLCQLGFIDHPDGRNMAQRLLGRRYPGQRVDELPLRGFTNQIGLILEPVARGLGFTVLPRFAVTAFAQQEKIRVIQSSIEVIDTLWLIYRAEWPLPARHQRLITVLKQRVAAH